MESELVNKISEDRINDPKKLNAEDQERLKKDPQAVLAIQENQALKELSSLVPPPPDRDRMLSAAFSGEMSESAVVPGPAVFRLNWVARAAMVTALALIITVVINITPIHNGGENGQVSLIPAQPAWASRPGVLMECETGTTDEEQALKIADSVDAKLRDTLAGHFKELQTRHEDLARQRDLLHEHEVYLASLEDGYGRNSGRSEEAREMYEELKVLLEDHNDQIEAGHAESHDLLQLARDHVNQLDSHLNMLDKELSVINEGNLQYLKREITRDDKGNCVITLALPAIPVELSEVRQQIDELHELHEVRMQNAVFFVRTETSNVSGTKNIEVNARVTAYPASTSAAPIANSHVWDTPEPDVVKAGILKVLTVSSGPSDLNVEIEGQNGHSAVILRREGEPEEKLESRSLGRGMVWYGLGEDESYYTYVNTDIECETGQNGIHGIGAYRLVESSEAGADACDALAHATIWTDGELKEIVTSVSVPGLVELKELEGKIVSVIGDAPEDKNIEVITETDGKTQVLKIVVDGEVIKILRIEDGNIEVVVTDTEDDEKKTGKEGESGKQ